MIEFKDYKLNEQLAIGPYFFEVRLSAGTKKYFLIGLGWDVEEIFRELKVDKYSYIRSIIGYELKGAFPETETLEDLNKVIKQLQIDYLIKEAKEKYPVGVDFRSIFNKFNYTSSGKFEWISENRVLRDVEVYGVIWHENKWAEIVTEEPKRSEINTYGLKVGDTLKKDVISAWVMQGPNRYQSEENSGKWGKGVNFIGDRKIESFKVIDGTVGFLVSGTNEVYLRAEGFKEFMESFCKPKFEVGKWYKCKGYGYAIKYLRKEARGSRYAVVYSDFISNNKEYESCPEGRMGVGYIDDINWYELTDLSEIQQYLPNGHPDKIKTDPEYIVGKWYKMGEWVAKFSELKEDQFWCSMSGTPHDNYKHCEYVFLSIRKHGIPELITDMTEVYKLFPGEKPKESEFEVNDWVVVEKWHHAKIPFPQTCQISRISPGGKAPYVILLNEDHYGNNEPWNFKKGEFRHATPEEVDKELERRWIARGERAAVFSDPGEGVVFENKPITLKSNQADLIVLEDQQVPELTITIKTNKTNKLFINPIKTITL